MDKKSTENSTFEKLNQQIAKLNAQLTEKNKYIKELEQQVTILQKDANKNDSLSTEHKKDLEHLFCRSFQTLGIY